MWAIRNKLTHELVAVAEAKPPGRDPEGIEPQRGEAPWEEQIDPGVEEIVELPGSADDVHAAIRARAEAPGVEVEGVVLPDSGVVEVASAPAPVPMGPAATLRRMMAERPSWVPAKTVTMQNLLDLLAEIQKNA